MAVAVPSGGDNSSANQAGNIVPLPRWRVSFSCSSDWRTGVVKHLTVLLLGQCLLLMSLPRRLKDLFLGKHACQPGHLCSRQLSGTSLVDAVLPDCVMAFSQVKCRP